MIVNVIDEHAVDELVAAATHRGHLLDLSEGGVRAVISGRVQLDRHAPLEVGLLLPSGDAPAAGRPGDDLDLWLHGTVVRTSSWDADRTEVAIELHEVPVPAADRIRRHVFARQAHDRALGLDDK